MKIAEASQQRHHEEGEHFGDILPRLFMESGTVSLLGRIGLQNVALCACFMH